MTLIVKDPFAITLNNSRDLHHAESIFKLLNLEYTTGYKFKIGVKPQEVETTLTDDYTLELDAFFLFGRFEYLILDSYILDGKIVVTIEQVKNEEN